MGLVIRLGSGASGVMQPEPSQDNGYLEDHVARLLRCYHYWTRRDLIEPSLSPKEAARALYCAPFVVLSHDNDVDPRFNYANLAAQQLFELPWANIVGLPSRLSAEPLAREARERLLARVAAAGYIDDYTGVRIAQSGKRFLIQQASVWNLFETPGLITGQAACFADWTPVSPTPFKD